MVAMPPPPNNIKKAGVIYYFQNDFNCTFTVFDRSSKSTREVPTFNKFLMCCV